LNEGTALQFSKAARRFCDYLVNYDSVKLNKPTTICLLLWDTSNLFNDTQASFLRCAYPAFSCIAYF